MKTSLYASRLDHEEITPGVRPADPASAELVICFGSRKLLAQGTESYHRLRSKFPKAEIAFCSTSGEIFNTEVRDDSLSAVFIEFEKTPFQTAMINIRDYANSYEAAKGLLSKLPCENLTSVLVLSEGNQVNGSELVKGLNDIAGNDILVTGGLAGDGADFKSTLVGLNGPAAEGNIVAIGFYGKNIVVSHGSMGGWDTFGPERTVTRSEGNKLFEIDHKNALELYKLYLGDEARNLPSSALLFPLSVVIPENSKPVVRTILSISEEDNSMTFAGDIPQGSKVRFMKANFDKLTVAAYDAASQTIEKSKVKPDLAILISCVGRKLILGQRIDEEVESVRELYGDQTLLTGFYSYGEISPLKDESLCNFHNQTMTITSFHEL